MSEMNYQYRVSTMFDAVLRTINKGSVYQLIISRVMEIYVFALIEVDSPRGSSDTCSEDSWFMAGYVN